jgi:inositol-pentakisphosphate 2-kinase
VLQQNLIFTNPPSESEEDQIRTAFADGLLPLLTQTPVLQLLNRLQRTLDMLDVEGLASIWEKWCRLSGRASENEQGGGCEEPTLEEWGSFIDRYLHELGLGEQSGQGPAELRNGHVEHAELPGVQTEEEMRFYLLAYLLSATFKDCSIIVRLPLLHSVTSGLNESSLDPSMVTSIDLDPKSMTRLKKWEVLDREIAGVYGQLREEEKKTCVDDWR